MGGRDFFKTILVLVCLVLFAPSSHAQTNLVGLFTIEAGSSFFMGGVGGTSLLGGTDGGLLTGEYQPDPLPTACQGDTTCGDRIIDPSSAIFFGFSLCVSTNPIDPCDGVRTYPHPSMVDNGDGSITADLRAWDAMWNEIHFNQGAPKDNFNAIPPQPDNLPPTGSYDSGTGAYSLSWSSLAVGGPFNGFIVEWYLVGHGQPVEPDRDGDWVPDAVDNCPDVPNYDQADRDGDGIGDLCDCDNDNDGYEAKRCGGTDCDDLNARIHPNALDFCNNGVDEDCDGEDNTICPEMIGTFTIEAGSTFYMTDLGGTDLLGGTDGGFLTGQYQPDPPPTTSGNDLTGSARIIDPNTSILWGFPLHVSTNETDLQTYGYLGSFPPPSVYDYGDGRIIGNLSSWTALWNGTHFNQGAPRDHEYDSPSGTYDPATGAYTLSWASIVIGGVDFHEGEWYLTGHFVPSVVDFDQDGVPDSSDNCTCDANPGQADLDADGLGDVCDPDADGDGHDKPLDCDDLNPNIHPAMTEICGNSMDENCDGVAPQCVVSDLSVISLHVPKKVRTCSREKKIAARIQNVGEVPVSAKVNLYKDFGLQNTKPVVLEPGLTARVIFYVAPSVLTTDALWCVEADIGTNDQTPDNNRACALMSVVGCE